MYQIFVIISKGQQVSYIVNKNPERMMQDPDTTQITQLLSIEISYAQNIVYTNFVMDLKTILLLSLMKAIVMVHSNGLL